MKMSNILALLAALVSAAVAFGFDPAQIVAILSLMAVGAAIQE